MVDSDEVPDGAHPGTYLEPAQDAIARLGAASVTDARRTARSRIDADPAGAITASRTLLESVCKVVLNDFNEEFPEREELPKLYKRVQRRLQLAPSASADPDIRPTLQGIASTIQGLGTLRNRAGDAHGQGRRTVLIERRHAVLAVESAETLANFLLETHELMRPWRGYEIAHLAEIPENRFGVWVPFEPPSDQSRLSRAATALALASTTMMLVKEYGAKGPERHSSGRTYFTLPDAVRHQPPSR